MKNTKEIILFYDEWKEFDLNEIAKEILSRYDFLEEPVIVPKRSESYGYASILSLLGLLFISLGCTLIIIFRYYGIGGI